MTRAKLRAGFALVAMCCLGCSGEGRLLVSGHVACDGAPLPKGNILFVPIAPSKGLIAGGEIINGRFEIPRDEGPLPGNYRVEIRAAAAPEGWDDPLAFAAQENPKAPVEPIAARYNAASELEVALPYEDELKFEVKTQ